MTIYFHLYNILFAFFFVSTLRSLFQGHWEKSSTDGVATILLFWALYNSSIWNA